MDNQFKLTCENFNEVLNLFKLNDQPLNEVLSRRIYERSNIEDWSTEPEVQEVLLRYILKHKPRTVVEIGTYKGKTTKIICDGLEENKIGKCYSIDKQMNNDVTDKLEHHIEDDRVILIEKESNSAFDKWGRAEIDLLFIDGDHSFIQSTIDFALWSRLVNDKGAIFIHDTRTRLLRDFPSDYIFPLSHYNIINIMNVRKLKSNHEWEGLARITHK